jgi:hypothetical protein
MQEINPKSEILNSKQIHPPLKRWRMPAKVLVAGKIQNPKLKTNACLENLDFGF